MQIVIYIFLALIGAAMGSFIGALTYRIHKKMDFVRGRSICEKCRKQLTPRDLIPVASWLILKGKCRYCRAKIGWQTLALEIGTAALFVCSYTFWTFGTIDNGLQIVLFTLFLIILTGMMAMAIYDARWHLLPNKIMFPTMVLSAVFWLISNWSELSLSAFVELALAMTPVAGIYGVMWIVSRGRWIGLGDVKFGVIVGFLSGSWVDATLVLVIANLIGTLIALPMLMTKRARGRDKIAFGPMLIAATIIVFFAGNPIIEFLRQNLLILT